MPTKLPKRKLSKPPLRLHIRLKKRLEEPLIRERRHTRLPEPLKEQLMQKESDLKLRKESLLLKRRKWPFLKLKENFRKKRQLENKKKEKKRQPESKLKERKKRDKLLKDWLNLRLNGKKIKEMQLKL